ncbi:MAG: hypothetical protein PHT40_01060 [Patescibacteria group bacterium]|nr:hypothetical protein [Patescibacteria group bacterium]
MKKKTISARITFRDRITGLFSSLFCKEKEENRPDGYHLMIPDETIDSPGEFLHTARELRLTTRRNYSHLFGLSE